MYKLLKYYSVGFCVLFIIRIIIKNTCILYCATLLVTRLSCHVNLLIVNAVMSGTKIISVLAVDKRQVLLVTHRTRRHRNVVGMPNSTATHWADEVGEHEKHVRRANQGLEAIKQSTELGPFGSASIVAGLVVFLRIHRVIHILLSQHRFGVPRGGNSYVSRTNHVTGRTQRYSTPYTMYGVQSRSD